MLAHHIILMSCTPAPVAPAAHNLVTFSVRYLHTRVPVAPAADNLLAKKANKHLLQDYDHRRAAAVDFMALVRPGLTVTAGPLKDPQVQLLKSNSYCCC